MTCSSRVERCPPVLSETASSTQALPSHNSWLKPSDLTLSLTWLAHVQDAEVVQRYAGSIASAARQTGQRPEALLIFINPFGGARRARQTWETVVQPLFRLAGDPVQVTCRCTSYIIVISVHILIMIIVCIMLLPDWLICTCACQPMHACKEAVLV